MKDTFGRQIDYMRISVTDRCNLRCCYCMPQDIPEAEHAEVLSYEEILRICKNAADLGICKFKITGGEPMVREGTVEFIRRLKQVPGVRQVTLTSNGLLLESYLDLLSETGIDGINISLDTKKEDRYQRITGSRGVSKVLSAVQKCAELGIRTKVNSVIIKEINDDEIYDLLEIGKEQPVDVRFIEMMPIGYGRQFTGMSADEVLDVIHVRYPELIDAGDSRGNGPARYQRIPGYQGCVGFIDAVHCKFCKKCNRIRLTSEGYLKPCLYYSRGIPLKEKLRHGIPETELSELIKRAVAEKPEEHRFYQDSPKGEAEQRNMSQIGG